MGFGSIARGQILRGILFLLFEIVFIFYMATAGVKWLAMLPSLGKVGPTKEYNEILDTYVTTYHDNSFKILLYGVLTIFFIIAFIYTWRVNVRQNKISQEMLEKGIRLRSGKDDLRSLVDESFYKTLLALPLTGILVFTVLPLVFMVLVAFTNYDGANDGYFSGLFHWVGLENFNQVLSWGNGIQQLLPGHVRGHDDKQEGHKVQEGLEDHTGAHHSHTAVHLPAVRIQDVRKRRHRKRNAPELGVDKGSPAVLDGSHVGKDLMLIATGILMNIPADLYESAKIDGASGWKQFSKITLPYMLFITGPYLLTSFTGNMNNFNVIYLLTGGNPINAAASSAAGQVGHTDLLSTWLFKITTGTDSKYYMASVVGILIFVILAIITLIVYNVLPSVKNEEDFQ